MTLSEKIVSLRKKHGWSQEDFAEKLNVSRQAISRWENGAAQPDAINILQISKLFKVTTDYLLNDDYESDGDIPTVQTAKKETKELYAKKKQHHLIAAICFTAASFCWLMSALICASDIQLALSCFSFVLCAVNAVIQFVLVAKNNHK